MRKTKRSDKQRLEDILAECVIADELFKSGKVEFDSNKHVRRSGLQALQVIGECALHISKKFKAANFSIPWDDMERMRHVIVHHYYKVDWSIVWKTIEHEVPLVKKSVEELLKNTYSEKKLQAKIESKKTLKQKGKQKS